MTRQGIIWTNEGFIYWLIYAFLSLDELNRGLRPLLLIWINLNAIMDKLSA